MQTGTPYVNPFGTANAACATNYRCAASDTPYNNDGFKACNGWNNVVTVWRQNTTTTTTTTTTSGGTGHGYRWR
jgi:limonene-1,2-epoxide hydrolase